ncbi:DnaB-like helicase N-terminal domain-containing protein [Microvirga ossetica]|uniref:DnaB-like helicase N-terminal domain-containing protein n=1 Tax=Microvirga ossetica TaxID=1882682 RepID=UPI001F243744|nr:DnaB-like helicase N-terminal domain-containing protein [Microvirga ossetica]
MDVNGSLDGRVLAKLRLYEERLCPACWKVERDQAHKEVNSSLPPLQGTEKQVAWALQIRADAVIELLKAKSEYRHDEIRSLVLEDFHQEAIKECSASRWIRNRHASFVDQAWRYHSGREPYYRFIAEGHIESEAEILVRQYQEVGTEFFNIEAEQGILGAMLVNNDVCDAVFFLKPEHFIEDLHKRLFAVMEALFNAGKIVTTSLLGHFLGNRDLGGITVSQYLDVLVEKAPDISDVKRLALTIYALSKCRSQMEA